MRNLLAFIVLAFLTASCTKELEFEVKTYEKKTTLPCKGLCPHALFSIPTALGDEPVADSINKKVFATAKEIIIFGEKQYDSKTYGELAADFIASYEKLQKESPDELIGWEGEIKGREAYRSEKIVNIELQHYTFEGGAHGYGGKRSLVFDLETGKYLPNDALFKDKKGFEQLAEKRFREKYKLAPNVPINSGGLMFEGEKFHLPETIFFTTQGILLYYNAYEIAAYAEGAQEILIPFSQADAFLSVK